MIDRKSLEFAAVSALGLGLAACVAETATFRPADAGGGRRGRSAATRFDIDVGGEDLGAIKIWSEGAYADPDNPAEVVIVVRLRIQNQSAAVMRLDLERSDVEVVTDDRKLHLIEAPVSTTGTITVEPGQIGRVGLRYPIPKGLSPEELGGFDFNFTIDTARGVFLETASFGRQRAGVHAAYFWPIWDPWWWGYPYAPWGWGLGFRGGVMVQPWPHGDRRGRPSSPHRR
jgi:hypothetical protein